MFDLVLQFAPSFHRRCSIRVVGDERSEAMFVAPASGLLPSIALTLEIDEARTAELRASCLGMLQAWDKRWSNSGLDGIYVDGTFEIAGSEPHSFGLWSPPKNSGAHAMLAAALACFPPQLCTGPAEAPLEILRSYFGLQPAIVVIDDGALRLRLAPWLHRTHAQEVELQIRSLPDDADLIIDAGGVERFGPALPNVLPMGQLRKRTSQVRWIARNDATDALLAAGVAPSEVETIPRSRYTATGHPIVLGGLVVSSPELIALAGRGAKIDLTRALREEHRLTVAQAAQAAAELAELVTESATSANTIAGG
jgi:hypothetical protein